MCVHRMSRQVAVDLNTEPSQSEQIVWDDPTAREERARLADNLQWPGSPSQHSEPLALIPPPSDQISGARDSMTDSELVEMGRMKLHSNVKYLYAVRVFRKDKYV